LTTAGSGVVEAKYAGYWFSGWTRYTINTDNTVDVESFSGADLGATIIESEADWDNLTFRVRYGFRSDELEETYVRTGY
jgi:hypothetical protein